MQKVSGLSIIMDSLYQTKIKPTRVCQEAVEAIKSDLPAFKTLPQELKKSHLLGLKEAAGLKIAVKGTKADPKLAEDVEANEVSHLRSLMSFNREEVLDTNVLSSVIYGDHKPKLDVKG